MELKDRELKDREEKIKRDIIISKDVMDKFEEQEMKKSRPMAWNNALRGKSHETKNWGLKLGTLLSFLPFSQVSIFCFF